MKTCRKTLSLVMVFALVMSLFCASVSADFTDQSSITNDEAAVVLTALDVIDGFDDGSFQPDTVLTREQAAAIIARMLLGSNADNLTAGSAPFSDVSADRWSAGYIAYCVSKGIVEGFEDGTFRPADNLTCYQFAKMLLVALGYDAGTEGLTGSTWAINSASYAINAGIFDDVASYSGDCDRDTAALMALNTLKADMVYYPSGSIEIDTGDSSIIIAGSSATRVTNNGSSDGNIDLDGYMQFAERYFTKLELSDAADGTYGRPATFTWELDGDVIYTGTDESNLVATYTGYVTKGTLYSAIGSSVYSLTEASTSLVEKITDTDLKVRNGYVRYLLDGSSVQTDYTATSSTVFVVYDTSDNDYDVYTGYNNVPNVSDSSGVTVSALTNSSGYSVAVIIFVGKNASVSGGGGTSGDFVLAYYGPSKSVDSYGNTYYSYYAFVNGEDTTVSSTERLTLGVLYTDISYDEYGYIDEADNLGTDNVLDNDEYFIIHWGSGGNPAIKYSSGVITMGTNGVLPLADSYDIYLVDTYYEDYDTVTASRFASKYSGKISNAVTVCGVYDDDGYIVSLYVVADRILDI